ncbi:hypothetical protein Scep_018939 [Stephania cephalantha]|uniref:Uncharacterized protein n=1 Tax=Stephania cephalantha TaxID=152367 RepID=A0AAP0IA60_9MAGN
MSRLQELALSLAHKCLSFDFVGTSLDESSEEFGTVQLNCSEGAVGVNGSHGFRNLAGSVVHLLGLVGDAITSAEANIFSAKHQRRRQELTQTTPDQPLDDDEAVLLVAGDRPKGCVYSLRSLWRKKRRYVDPDASTSQVLAQRRMSNFMILSAAQVAIHRGHDHTCYGIVNPRRRVETTQGSREVRGRGEARRSGIFVCGGAEPSGRAEDPLKGASFRASAEPSGGHRSVSHGGGEVGGPRRRRRAKAQTMWLQQVQFGVYSLAFILLKIGRIQLGVEGIVNPYGRSLANFAYYASVSLFHAVGVDIGLNMGAMGKHAPSLSQGSNWPLPLSSACSPGSLLEGAPAPG